MDHREAFRVLASADRQLVLHELVAKEGEVSVEELSRRVAARRHGLPSEKIGDAEVARARIRLLHAHLPKMAEANVVDVDRDDGDVALVDDADTDRLFEAAAELDSWPPDDLLERPSRSG